MARSATITKPEYDLGMQRLNRAMGAGFAAVLALAVSLLLAPGALAQINGVPPSVTSMGFGGHPGAIRGVPPSVTSLGHKGYAPGIIASRPPVDGHRPHRPPRYPWGGAVYAVPYYPYYDDTADAQPAEPPEDEYRGGPTIFDRRGPGTPSRPPVESYSSRAESPEPVVAAEAAPVAEQAPTVLVFKDGHQDEVANYAIVGNTLYDFAEGRRRKIPLSDLDLTATAKENDDRGIDFRVPTASEAN